MRVIHDDALRRTFQAVAAALVLQIPAPVRGDDHGGMFRTGPAHELPVYDPRFGNDTLRYALIDGRVIVDGDLDLGTEMELLRRSWELALKTSKPFDARDPRAAGLLETLRLDAVERAKLQQLGSRKAADFPADDRERAEGLVRFANEALRPLQERRKPDDPRNVREHASVIFGVVSGELRWPRGEIPYTVDKGGPDDALIIAATDHWRTRTRGRINFVRCDPMVTRDYVLFVRVAGKCESDSVGKKPGGGEQFVRLDPRCGPPQVIHELGHVVGMLHEHNRLDRASFLRVDETQMEKGAVDQFSQTLFAGSDVNAFDWKSIMLYPPKAFSKGLGENQRQTLYKIVPPMDTEWGLKTGPGNGVTECLSDGDVAAVLKFYGDDKK